MLFFEDLPIIFSSFSAIHHSKKYSELQLNTGLEELCVALEVESVKVSIAIGCFQPHIFGEVPVDHRCDSPERASLHTVAIEIGVGVSEHQFPGPWSSAEDSSQRSYVL